VHRQECVNRNPTALCCTVEPHPTPAVGEFKSYYKETVAIPHTRSDGDKVRAEELVEVTALLTESKDRVFELEGQVARLKRKFAAKGVKGEHAAGNAGENEEEVTLVVHSTGLHGQAPIAHYSTSVHIW